MPLVPVGQRSIFKDLRRTIRYMTISSNRRFKAMILIKKPAGEHCGISFDCVAALGNEQYSWMDLLTMFFGFDLAGFCVCPKCLTLGEVAELIKFRK